jgi:hypothetical protein
MVSYVKFRDVAAVITAGNQLTTAGTSLAGRVGVGPAACQTIKSRAAATLTGSDDYAKAFSEVYHKETESGPRDVVLETSAGDIAQHAAEIGPKVVQVATEMLYVDAVNGAAMTRSLRETRPT